MFQSRNAFLCLILAALLASSGFAQRGMYVAPRDLTQLTTDAHVIFRGHIASVAVQEHPSVHGMYTVLVTMKVDEVLKGQPGAVYTFRQFIWDLRDRNDAAGYSKGQEVLMFMNAPNAQQLSSPTGMQQGRFSIKRGKDGSAVAVNGAGNANLFRGTADMVNSGALTLSKAAAQMVSSPKTGGAVPLTQLQQVIAALLGVKR